MVKRLIRIGKLLPILLLVLLIFTNKPILGISCKYYLKRLKQRYSCSSGLIITYKREMTSKSMDMLGNGMQMDTAKGKMFLMSPYFFKILQQYPTQEYIVTDGKHVWWYIPLKNIAYEYKAQKFSKELNILKELFTGMINITKNFHIICQQKNHNNISLVLKPIKPWQDIEKISIGIDAKDFRIRFIKISNFFGSTTIFNFLNETKTHLKKEIFYFNPPQDVRIIKK